MTTTHVPQLHHYRLYAAVMLAAAILALALSLVATAAEPILRPGAVAPDPPAHLYFTVLPPPPMYTVLP